MLLRGLVPEPVVYTRVSGSVTTKFAGPGDDTEMDLAGEELVEEAAGSWPANSAIVAFARELSTRESKARIFAGF